MDKKICDKCDKFKCVMAVWKGLKTVASVPSDLHISYLQLILRSKRDGYDYIILKAGKKYEAFSSDHDRLINDFKWEDIDDFVPDKKYKEACPYFMEHMISSLTKRGNDES